MFKSAAVLKNSDGKIIGGVETLTDLSEALAKEAIISDLRQVLNAKDGYQSMTGKSTAMQHVYELITSVAKSDIPVIIYGENGTGKELAANAIYNISDRKKGHFIKVNCAALNESLLESELFGHGKGAYTGALKTRIGRFEAAHKGAIFLDEIGDIPVIEHAFVLCREGEITPDHLPSNLFKKQIKQPQG
ncbi:MAG: sigma 54-interacting transcriptional regulator [Desulfobacteraceae bacterium]|nr:sigma 54-interacting transcriptional regulator [Desulfobacteraceae bacterium]